jgi:hypothetical protein
MFWPVAPVPATARLPDSMIVWGLTRVFNPAALSRQRFLRDHNELWISRSVLMTLYGPSADSPLGHIPLD